MPETMTIEKTVQAVLDKQAEIVGGLVTRSDASFAEIRSAMSDVEAELAKYTSDDAPHKVTERASHKAMIEEQFAGMMSSLREEVQRQIAEVEVAFNLKTAGGTVDPANDVQVDPRDKIAEMMLADGAAEKLAAHKRAGNPGFLEPTKIPSLILAPPRFDAMYATPMADADLGALTPRFRRPDVVFHLREATDIVSLFRRVPTGGRDRYEWARQKFEGLYGAHFTTVDGAHGDAVTVIAVADASHLVEDSLVRFFTTAGVIAKFISISTNNLTISDTPGGAGSALGVALSGGEQVSSEMYAATVEGAAKPEGTDSYEEIEQVLINMATFKTITEQRLTSVPSAQAFINRDLVDALRRNMDWQTLYAAGDGTRTATVQPGLINETGAQTLAWSSGQSKDTRADLILRVADLIHSDDAGNLTAIMNKLDWTKIVTAKGTDGHYVTNRGPVLIVDEPGRRFVGPHMVRRSGMVNEGDVFVIDPAVASEIADLEDASLAMGRIDKDFTNNVVRLRYDHRMLHAILSITGYGIGDWDSQPA